jgi:UDP-GlcNAc:undecaprenyl-phosphate GlcNAc-1-phosphate transferase
MTAPGLHELIGIVMRIVLAFGCSFAFTGALCWLIPRLQRIDSTVTPMRSGSAIPRFGGVAIALAVVTATVVATQLTQYFFGQALIGTEYWVMVLDGFFLVFLGAIIDDTRGLSPAMKFLFQGAGASVAIWFGLRVEEVSFFGGGTYHLGALAVPLTYLWIIGMTNAYNLVDGLDGLASGLGAIAAGTCMVLFAMRGDFEDAAMLAVLVGALAGFLPYNFNPARIYLGDAGSQLIGYLLAVTAIRGTEKQATALAVVIPLLIFGLPILDTMISMIRRFSSGLRGNESISLLGRYRLAARLMFVGDHGHIHHRLLALGLSHRHAVLALYAAGAVLSGLAMLSVLAQYRNAGLILATVGCATAIGIGKLGYADTQTLRIGWALRWFSDMKFDRTFFFGYLDLFLISCAYWAAYFLVYGTLSAEDFEDAGQWYLNMFPIVMTVQFAFFYLFGLYRGIWQAVGVGDLIRVCLSVCTGGVLSYAIVLVNEPLNGTASLFIVEVLILGWLMGGVRSAYRVVGHFQHKTQRDARGVLIYGAGLGGQLVLRELRQNTLLGYRPDGFIDDDSALKGRVIDSVSVLGSSEDLKGILDRLPVETLIVSSNKIAGYVLQRALLICKRKGIDVIESDFQLRPLTLEQMARIGRKSEAEPSSPGSDRWMALRRLGNSESAAHKTAG